MNPWLDGFSALADHAPAALAFLLVMLWGFIVIRKLLASLFGDSLTGTEILSIASAGWIAPVLFLSLSAFGASLLFNEEIGGILALLLIFISTLAPARKKLAFSPVLILAAILFVSIVLRFAFIRDLLLPSYFDPAEHYRLIDSLARSHRTGALAGVWADGYYHPGFHLIGAGVSHFLQVNILEFMLVVGPLLLAILPFPLFFLVKRETQSVQAALFACLLAGFGFHMPAHLLNWGKYPALLSLASMLFVFSLVYLARRSSLIQHRKSVFVLLALAVFVSALIHSRTFIVYGLTTLAILATVGWNRLRVSYRSMAFIAVLCLFAVEIYAFYNNPALKTLPESYLENDSWALALVLLLTLIAAVHYPAWTFFLIAWLALCGLCLFIPIPIPAHGIQTLLDRPFAQALAYLPLSMLGGLGLAGIARATARLFPESKLVQRSLPSLLFGLILLNAALRRDFYPSDCCRFAGPDDLAAFTWMDQTLPPDAKVLIASSGLYVTSFEPPQKQTGVDAGIWIPALLSRRVELSGADIRFDLADTHQALCRRDTDYIYIGAMPQSFDRRQLDAQPAWYLQAFALPAAQVFQVTGCE